MSVLCLDLSLSSTGYAKFTVDGKLMDKGKIVPDTKLENGFKIQYIVNKIKEMYHGVDTLIIEDVFLGMNFAGIKELIRLSGAVMYSWIMEKYKLPIFYMASQARKLAGIPPTSQKAETQIFVLDKYKFVDKIKIEEFKLKVKEIQTISTKSKKKYQFEKLSKLIEIETSHGNDVCDAILLGIGHFNKKLKGGLRED